MEMMITAPLDKKNKPKGMPATENASAPPHTIPSKKTTKTTTSTTTKSCFGHKYPTRFKKQKESQDVPADEGGDDDHKGETDEEDENENEEEDETKNIIVEHAKEEEEDNTCKELFKKDGSLDKKKYTTLLSSLFPSKYMNQKIENINGGSSNSMHKQSNTKHSNTKHKSSRKLQYTTPPPLSPMMFLPHITKNTKTTKAKATKKLFSEEDDEMISLGSEDTQEEEEEEEEMYKKSKKRENNHLTTMLKNGSKFNIIFTMGGDNRKCRKNHDDDYYDEEEDDEDAYDNEDEDDSDYETEDEDDDEDEEEDEESEEESEEGESEEEEKVDKKKNTIEDQNDSSGYMKLKEIINGLSEKERNSSTIKNVMETLEKKEAEDIKKRKRAVKKEKTKNTKSFKKLLREKNVMNDVQFFKDKMTPEQQVLVNKQLAEITKYSEVEKPYRLALIDSDIPIAYKACAIKKINTLRYMDPGAGEYYKIKNWVDTFMQIPFGKHKVLPLTINDGIEKCHEFMENAKKILDDAVYGLNDAKLQIMQMVGQWLVNPSAIGTAIAIKGPMGTGKTTLVKEGISKILGRDFAFIALGGATDSSFLEGHSYTYEGSSWGKIVDILIHSKSMNPVIYFDELDKVSDTPKGEEIIGILTHLTDTTQNSKFHDKYFAGIDFDISRCLFIFSYNDESKVNPILRDRMYRIHTKGYDLPQKTIISNNHLLPKIREQVAFKTDEIIVPDDTIHYIINNHTEKEDGVRNLKRCLEIIHTKLNLYRLMKPGVNLFETDGNMQLTVEFPITVTPHIIDKLIKKSNDSGAWAGMYS